MLKLESTGTGKFWVVSILKLFGTLCFKPFHNAGKWKGKKTGQFAVND